MEPLTIFLGSNTAPIQHAASFLHTHGWQIAECPSDHVTHLLLPIPSLDQSGYIKGSNHDLGQLLQSLPENVRVIGGNLNHISIPQIQIIDLLKDEAYLAKNASLTAHCALKAVSRHIEYTFQDLPVLVIGWGRIGKCLARLLRLLDANVTVAVRKEGDQAMLQALGYRSCSISQLSTDASQFDLIFNTVPHPVLHATDCHPSAVLAELASSPGILGDGVIDARGLPGKEAPKSSGELISKTILRIVAGKEQAL